MRSIDLDLLHKLSGDLDFSGTMDYLLREVQRGRIADRRRLVEEETIATAFAEIFATWDKILPPFPKCRFRRRTLARELAKGRRDAYLRDIIISCAQLANHPNRLIVNLAAVYGGNARLLARALPQFEVLATDIDPRGDAVFSVFSKTLKNYRFLSENVYQPNLNRRPYIVVFFGACGSLTDASMQYAIDVNSPFLICRSCCHDNTGGNTDLVPRLTLTNLIASFKNIKFLYYSKKTPGYYFCDWYDKSVYPRSTVAKALINSERFMQIVRNCADSDICRSIIDLDRCLYLVEHDYDVLYREELFFAHKYVVRSRERSNNGTCARGHVHKIITFGLGCFGDDVGGCMARG